MDIKIGDLIFLLNPKPPRIIPGKIVEQIITRNVSGEEIKHIVQFSSEKNYTLENIEKPWFTSLEDAGSYLESEAKKLIDKVLSEGRKRAESEFFSDTNVANREIVFEELPVSEQPATLESKSSDELTVDLGDGKFAKVTLPEVLK